MVEGKFLHIRACLIWCLGWSFHQLHVEYIWCDYFPAYRLDGGKRTLVFIVLIHLIF